MSQKYSVKLETKSQCIQDLFVDIIASTGDYYIDNSAKSTRPYLYIIEVGDPPEADLELISAHLASNPSTEIFLTSSQTQPEVLLKALKLGIKEFFPQPLNEDEIRSALLKLKERLREIKPVEGKQGRVIAVIATKGGCGGTTVAVNTAVCLARVGASPVALVDLDMETGISGLFMGMESPYGIYDTLDNIERLDDAFLMNIMSKHPSGVYTLHSPGSIGQSASIQPEHIKKILELMQSIFGYIVVDTGALYSTTTPPAIEMADDILLVLTLEIHSVFNARKYLQALSALHYPENNIKLIINRYHKSESALLKEAEKALGKKPYWLITNNYPAAIDAANRGVPVVETAPGNGIARSLEGLALKINGTVKRQKSFNPFGKLFGFFSGNGTR